MLVALLAATVGSGCPRRTPEWEMAFDATATGWLLSVWGPSPDNLYAVGGTPTDGTMARFDGSDWAPVETGLATPLLNWVHGFGADDITVVGSGGTVIHWNGAVWELQVTPLDHDLWGVWGATPDDLWAVGGNGRDPGQAVVLHYDGLDWVDETPNLPVLQRPNVYAFFKVWGTSADNVWVVGQRGVVLHWDGGSWSEELVGTSEDLISLWGTGPDRMVLVGGRGNGEIVTWNGSEWRAETLAPLPGLNGVWMRNPGVIHAVGTRATAAVIDFDTLEYETSLIESSQDLHAVFGDASGTLTAVGGNLLTPVAPYRGIALSRPLLEEE